MVSKADKIINEKIKLKKYEVAVVLRATRVDIEISPEKEKKLKEIIGRILVLQKEQDELFKIFKNNKVIRLCKHCKKPMIGNKTHKKYHNECARIVRDEKIKGYLRKSKSKKKKK